MTPNEVADHLRQVFSCEVSHEPTRWHIKPTGPGGTSYVIVKGSHSTYMQPIRGVMQPLGQHQTLAAAIARIEPLLSLHSGEGASMVADMTNQTNTNRTPDGTGSIVQVPVDDRDKRPSSHYLDLENSLAVVHSAGYKIELFEADDHTGIYAVAGGEILGYVTYSASITTSDGFASLLSWVELRAEMGS